MAKHRLLVPEAREALETFKQEMANEFAEGDTRNLASKHTGLIVRDLVRIGQEQLDPSNKMF